MSPKRLGATVKRLRQARQFTQRELAKKARMSPAYLSRIEAGGQRNPGIKIVQRLAKALGVPVTALLEG